MVLKQNQLPNIGRAWLSLEKRKYKMTKMIETEEDEERVTGDGPYFDTRYSTNVTALTDHTTFLNCRVAALGNRTVGRILSTIN